LMREASQRYVALVNKVVFEEGIMPLLRIEIGTWH
jgi:hypothetical protein